MKYLKITFLTFLILSVSALSAQDEEPCGKVSKKVSKQFEEAMSNYGQAQKMVAKLPASADRYYLEANRLLKEVIDVDAEFAPAYYYLGCINVFKKDNNLTAAEKYFKKAIELCPDGMHDAYFQLGKIYFGLDKYDQAELNLKKYLDKPEEITDDSIQMEAKGMYDWAKTAMELLSKPVSFNPTIVPGISSKFDEYLVIISPDNEKAFYTRRIEERNVNSWASEMEFKEKFFVSNRKPQPGKQLSEIPFDAGQAMPDPFNMNLNEGGATVTIDNKELIYTICHMPEQNSQDQYMNCDLYYTRFEFGGWSDIIPLDAVNTKDNWESQPSISSDGKTLYFISDRPGGIGGYDIYTSTRDENGNWSAPQNMGKTINSKGNDKSPFIHTDSQTLYFSSEGRPGMGGYDIYYARMDDNGTWQKPVNIGYPINSKYDDVGFFVSTDGKYGYFGSNNMSDGLGGWDFYSFELYEEARPEKVLFVKGTVKNEQDDKPVEAKIEIKNLTTREIKEIPIDQETGEYVAAIKFESDFMLTVKKPDFVYESTYISKEDTSFAEPTSVNVDLEPVQLGKAYRMKDIYYESSSADLTAESKKVLDEFTEFLLENPNIKVKIQGHTDDVGSDAFNLTLSENRAHSVYNYLVSKGISSSRLCYKGYGETQPVDTNDTEAGRAMNRRTEFLVTGM
ncbi:MAG TPA: OmpA family protein [Bacteroidales bacterium]|nr:OmpA family protein [Bacteroidales bacterium]